MKDKLAAQQKAFDAQQKVMQSQQKTIDSMKEALQARPKGYTKAFITIGNFHRLPTNDATLYWARIDH